MSSIVATVAQGSIFKKPILKTYSINQDVPTEKKIPIIPASIIKRVGSSKQDIGWRTANGRIERFLR